MTKDDFFNLLTEEVKTYKNFLETANNEWIVKGFVESSGKCKISKYFYKTRFLGLKTLIFCAVYH